MNECLLTLKMWEKIQTTYMADESLPAPSLPPATASVPTLPTPSRPVPSLCASCTLASSQLPAQARVFLCGVGRHVLPSPRKVLTCPPYLANSYPALVSQLKCTLLVPCTPPPTI